MRVRRRLGVSPNRARDPSVDDEWLKLYKSALGSDRGAAARLAKQLNVSPAALSKLKTQGSAWLVFGISRVLRIPPPRTLMDRAQYELLCELEVFRRHIEAAYRGAQGPTAASRDFRR